MGSKRVRGTTRKSRKIIPGALLGPSWGQFWPIWARRGPFKPILKPTWHPSCYLQALKTTRRPPKNQFASFLKVVCLEKLAKSIDFPVCFMVWASCLVATYHAHRSPSKPNICLRWPLGPPKKGQGGPKIAQDGPKMVPKGGEAQRETPAR